MSSVSKLVFCLSLLLLAFLTGCVQESVDADTKIFIFDTWVAVLAIVLPLIALIAGLALRKSHQFSHWGWCLIAGGLLFGIVIGPGMYHDRVTVSPERFTLRCGFWFAPTTRDVSFADVRSIKFDKEVRRGRRGRKSTSYDLMCQMNDGSITEVPIGTLMDYAIDDILATAKRQRIAVINEQLYRQ